MKKKFFLSCQDQVQKEKVLFLLDLGIPITRIEEVEAGETDRVIMEETVQIVQTVQTVQTVHLLADVFLKSLFKMI